MPYPSHSIDIFLVLGTKVAIARQVLRNLDLRGHLIFTVNIDQKFPRVREQSKTSGNFKSKRTEY